MKYQPVYRGGAVCLPAAALDLCDDIQELRLLMLLSYDRAMGDADNETLAGQLGCTAAELEQTVVSLRAAGLLEPEKKPAPSAASKNLSGEEMADLIGSDATMGPLIAECQNLCGKMLTPTDVSRIVSLRKELGYDSETILLLFFYLSEKLDAVGRRLTVSYAEKSAYTLHHKGIRTAGQLQDYIRKTEEKNSLAFRFRRLFGMGDRKATNKEQRFFAKWTEDWQMPFELIETAYEISVDKTGSASLDYISKILSEWHEKGIATVEQAEAESAAFRAASPYRRKFREKQEEVPPSSFDTGDFFDKALQRSYAVMSRAENEDKKEAD